MRWTAKTPQKKVLAMLLASHMYSSNSMKSSILCCAIGKAEEVLWWYLVEKSYCDDYNDGAVVGYDEPISTRGLHGLRETDHGYVLFKKADTKYLGRAPAKYAAVKSLQEAAQ